MAGMTSHPPDLTSEGTEHRNKSTKMCRELGIRS